ncbi:MAG: dTMP kinase [Calditrichaeota bacterium]|nr:dTMP kinase [Calditrichota bacterium]
MVQPFRHFISFEGIDYCGKTTQIQRLVERLKEHGVEVEVVREPGGTIISEKIREILLDRSHEEMHDRTEILLYAAARSQLVHQKILPLLQKGVSVIADRYYDSTTAYQGYGRGLNIDFVKQLNQFATSGLSPFKTIFLDISPEEAERRRLRKGQTQDRLESGGVAFYRRIREGFFQIAREEPERFVIVPAEQDIDAIADQIWDLVRQWWQL